MSNIIILGITSLLTDISSEMVYPILPVFLVSALGASPAVLGLVEGVAESLASLLKVFSGYFSDKGKARRPLTILGYAGSTFGKFFLFMAASWGWVFTGRVIDRVGKGIRTAPRDALIADSADAGKRGAAFGLHRAMDTIGAVTGVAIAYFLVTRFKGGFKEIFLYSLIPAVLGVFFLFFVREKKQEDKEKKPVLHFAWRTLDKRLKLLRAQKVGNPLATVILLYLVYNITYVIVAYPAAFFSDRIGRKKILVAGYIFYGLVYLGFALNNRPDGFWFLFGLYGLYIGFTEGVEKALVVDIAPPQFRATAIGLHATIVGLGLLPASLIAGFLWKIFGAQAPFYFGSFMGLIASVGFWFVLKGL